MRQLVGGERLAQPPLRERQVDLRQRLERIGDRISGAPYLRRELAEDARHLPLLIRQKGAPAVPHLDRLQWLQEDRGAGR